MTTSTNPTTIIEQLMATISREWHNIWRNDAILSDVHVQEVNAQAANWLKEPPHCPIHTNEPMYQLLMETPEHKKGEWMCHECADKIRFARAEVKPKLWSTSPTYTGGSIMLAINAKEQAYKQELINRIAMERVPTLPKNTGEIPQVVKTLLPQANIPTLLPQKNVPTAPLAARDIVYAPTPLDDEDLTEHRLPIIKISKDTKEMRAEVLFDEIMRRPTHERGTGEQQKINEDAFLL